MSYSYAQEKQAIFTDEGQRTFLKIRDRVAFLINEAGACTMLAAVKGVSGSNWFHMACVDRLVELGEICELTELGVAGQHRVFVKGGAR